MKLKTFDLGIILSYLTGAMMVINNIIYFIKYIRGSLADITSAGIGNLDAIGAAMFVAPSLGVYAGVTLLFITYFGLKKRLVWTWYLYLILIIMVPIPVLVAQLTFNLFPMALFTVALGFGGVALTGLHFFSPERD